MIGTLHYPRRIEASLYLNNFGPPWQVSHIRQSKLRRSSSTTVLPLRIYNSALPSARGHLDQQNYLHLSSQFSSLIGVLGSNTEHISAAGCCCILFVFPSSNSFTLFSVHDRIASSCFVRFAASFVRPFFPADK